MDFEWDNAKAWMNRRKHGIDFHDAIPALLDPNRMEDVDDRFDYGETRVRVTGMAHSRVLLVAVTLPQDGVCRIISARRATRDEENRYYTGDREAW